MCTWYRAIRVDPPGAMLLKKTGSPLLSSHCPSIAPQLEVGGSHKQLLPPSMLQCCLAGSGAGGGRNCSEFMSEMILSCPITLSSLSLP